MIEDKEFEKILKIIKQRETNDLKFQRFIDEFNLECERCGRKSAKNTVLFGLICIICDSHLIEKNEKEEID